ncbi:hypothetical protein [Chryseobacterium limigenitum]|uniref:hypothetical protein n=1 Tax=Chryseobacterium limigenitum TaxID=1612149 RepID=UPI00147CD8BE|nr:hypothetical protein [Chryseobacterium limigenitum]
MSAIATSSNSIEQAINRLAGETGEIRLKGKNLELVKQLWDQHRTVLLSCK